MLVRRGLFFFGMIVAAFYLKDLAFPNLQGWPNVLLATVIGGTIGYLSVLLIREKK
jgi:hypothetical protein